MNMDNLSKCRSSICYASFLFEACEIFHDLIPLKNTATARCLKSFKENKEEI